jgi:hypothetical protein
MAERKVVYEVSAKVGDTSGLKRIVEEAAKAQQALKGVNQAGESATYGLQEDPADKTASGQPAKKPWTKPTPPVKRVKGGKPVNPWSYDVLPEDEEEPVLLKAARKPQPPPKWSPPKPPASRPDPPSKKLPAGYGLRQDADSLKSGKVGQAGIYGLKGEDDLLPTAKAADATDQATKKTDTLAKSLKDYTERVKEAAAADRAFAKDKKALAAVVDAHKAVRPHDFESCVYAIPPLGLRWHTIRL